MASFAEDYIPALVPAVLAGENAQVYVGVTIALPADALGDILTLAVRMAFGHAKQPDDALKEAGLQRGLVWVPGELKTDFQSRVKAAWTSWARAGTAESITSILELIGFTNPTVVPDPLWSSAWSLSYLPGDHPGPDLPWTWDGAGIIWDGGYSWDSGVEAWRTEILRYVCSTLKAAHESLTHVRLYNDSSFFWDQSGISWDDPGVFWDSGSPGDIIVKPYPGFVLT